MPLLIDLESLTDEQTDRYLGDLFKALHSHDHDDAIWAEMDSPFLRRMVELFTERGLMRLNGFRDELIAWINGEKHVGGERPPRPAGAMERWSPAEVKLVKLYLEALPPDEFALDDWMMMVDYLVQRYLPADDLRSEAEWLAVRSTLMGRVQANMEKLTAREADTVLAALPVTVEAAEQQFEMTHVQRAILQFAATRGAENVTGLADDVRHKMRRLIAEHAEDEILAGKGKPAVTRPALQTKLLDEFATMNRDWRRIAITEATENAGQGYVASQRPGAKLKRWEHYRNACAWCRKIDGMVMEVVPPDAPDKDGSTQIWPGKNNIGRSASPRKRVGGVLVPREPDEMYHVASGAQHPHCRGRWLPVIEDSSVDDLDFGNWLRNHLGKKE